MYSVGNVVVVFVWVFVSSSLAVEQCFPSNTTGYSSCACKLNNEKYINLSPLQNSTVIPRFTTKPSTKHGEEGWRFSYNPCTPFSKFVDSNLTSFCKDVAAARWTETSAKGQTNVCQDLGDQDTAEFDTTPYRINMTSDGLEWSNTTLIFRSTEKANFQAEPKNRALIHLVCNANMTKQDSKFHFLREDHTHLNDYYFVLESPCACPGLCGEPPSPEPTANPSKGDNGDDKWLIIGVSIGAVVVLLLIILAVVCCRKRKAGYSEV